MKIISYLNEPLPSTSVTLLDTIGAEVLVTGDWQAQSAEVAIIGIQTRVDRFFLKQHPLLRYLLSASAGTDHIDMKACKTERVKIVNAAGANAEDVAEYVLALLLNLTRKIPQQVIQLERGSWREWELMGESVSGKTLGLVGYGAIGKLVAERAKIFGITPILAFEPHIEAEVMNKEGVVKVDYLKALLYQSDYVSLHVPLLPQTYHLIAKEELAAMKPNAYLINTSRGGIVDETALIAALDQDRLAGAALDVFENEPQINQKLVNSNKIITTPHLGAFTRQAREKMIHKPIAELVRMLKFKPTRSRGNELESKKIAVTS